MDKLQHYIIIPIVDNQTKLMESLQNIDLVLNSTASDDSLYMVLLGVRNKINDNLTRLLTRLKTQYVYRFLSKLCGVAFDLNTYESKINDEQRYIVQVGDYSASTYRLSEVHKSDIEYFK